MTVFTQNYLPLHLPRLTMAASDTRSRYTRALGAPCWASREVYTQTPHELAASARNAVDNIAIPVLQRLEEFVAGADDEKRRSIEEHAGCLIPVVLAPLDVEVTSSNTNANGSISTGLQDEDEDEDEQRKDGAHRPKRRRSGGEEHAAMLFPTSLARRRVEPRRSSDHHRHSVVDCHSVVESRTTDAVLSVAMFHPRSRHRQVAEVDVAASQPLSVLRDMLKCTVDTLCVGPYDPAKTALPSSSPSPVPPRKPAYFVLRGQTLIAEDTRLGAALDPPYATSVNTWRVSLGEQPLEVTSMAVSCGSVLALEQKASEVPTDDFLVHRGTCVHRICVVAVRAATVGRPSAPDSTPVRDGPLEVEQLPRATFATAARPIQCRVCSRDAAYATTDDDVADSRVSLWCRSCFDLLHTADGSAPTANFSAVSL